MTGHTKNWETLPIERNKLNLIPTLKKWRYMNYQKIQINHHRDAQLIKTAQIDN